MYVMRSLAHSLHQDILILSMKLAISYKINKQQISLIRSDDSYIILKNRLLLI